MLKPCKTTHQPSLSQRRRMKSPSWWLYPLASAIPPNLCSNKINRDRQLFILALLASFLALLTFIAIFERFMHLHAIKTTMFQVACCLICPSEILLYMK